MSSAEKMLPCNLEAERATIGSLVLYPEQISLVADILRPEHFYRDAHQTIYGAMLHLYERREPCDQFSVCEYLERIGKLEQVGGINYIGLSLTERVFGNSLEFLASKVIDAWSRRKLIEAGSVIVSEAYSAENAQEAIEKAEELVYGLGKVQSSREAVAVGDVLSSMFAEMTDERSPDGTIVGVPTGFYTLDQMTGGLQKSDLIILAGRPSMGKSSLMMNIARHAAMKYGRGVLAFSLEMSKEQLTQRLVAHEARLNLKRLRMKQLSSEEQTRCIDVSGAIVDAPIWVDDTPALSLSAMRSKIRRTLGQRDIDLIVVDYLGKMTATMDGKRIGNRLEEVSEIARGLKDLAREFQVPVLALAQLNRGVESRQDKVPQLSDLRDSGEIEQEADIVMFIHRDDYYAGFNPDGTSKSNRPGTADIIFSKHRNGDVGEVLLGFDGSQTRFYNLGDDGREFCD
jgi:replicative DNA helicase